MSTFWSWQSFNFVFHKLHASKTQSLGLVMKHERLEDSTNDCSYARFFSSTGIHTCLSHATKHNSTFIATFLTPLTVNTDVKTTLVFHSKSRTHEQQQIDVVGFIVGCFLFIITWLLGENTWSYLVPIQYGGSSNLTEKRIPPSTWEFHVKRKIPQKLKH